jgi:hypothetical protein
MEDLAAIKAPFLEIFEKLPPGRSGLLIPRLKKFFFLTCPLMGDPFFLPCYLCNVRVKAALRADFVCHNTAKMLKIIPAATISQDMWTGISARNPPMINKGLSRRVIRFKKNPSRPMLKMVTPIIPVITAMIISRIGPINNRLGL